MVTQRLHDLRDELGSESFDEVIALFLQETDDMTRKLRARASPDTLSADLHFLKGAALNLGFDTLAEACQDAAHAACEGQTAVVDLDAILQTYAAEKTALAGSGLAGHRVMPHTQPPATSPQPVAI